MGQTCNCIGLGFTSIKCLSDVSPFIITGYLNNRPYYVGTFNNIIDVGNPLPPVECKVYWDNGSSQWVIQQTDPSFPEILWFSNVDSQNVCSLTNSDWQAGDFTNFPCTSLNLVVQLIDCPPLDCFCCFLYAECDTLVGYLDCNGETQSFSVIEGQVYTFCGLFGYYLCPNDKERKKIPTSGLCVDGECPCNCYETTIPENCDGAEIGYIDCSGNLVTFIANKNETYSFCSKIGPLTNCRPSITFLLKGGCIEGQCSEPIPTTTTTTTTYVPAPNVPLEPTNECDVITIFPMGVECINIDPSFIDTFDGSASLYITGGTPPYEILWENGNVGPTINNLGVGEYRATVTDSYGDFLINTTCVLSAETPSPTTTTTSTTPPISFGDLCMIIKDNSSRVGSNKFIDFIYNGYFNNKPNWLSNDGDYFMYWNTGTTEEWLISGNTSFVVYNSNPNVPPLSGWQILGGGKNTVTVLEGSCNNVPPLGVQISKNDSTCENDGSIIISAYGGFPPYSYSLNNGVTTQTNPIFQNLTTGNYNVSVIDSLGFIETQSVTINPTNFNTAYTVIFNQNGDSFEASVSPTLPPGFSVSFDLIFQNEFIVAPSPSSATNTITTTVLLNGSPLTNPSPVITNYPPNFNACDGNNNVYTTESTYIWNITLTNSDSVTGIISSSVSTVNPQPPCFDVFRRKKLYLDNLKINGCECCFAFIKQPSFGKGEMIG